MHLSFWSSGGNNNQPLSGVYCDQQSIQFQIQVFVIMDTPKRQISWLESFQPDIWAYFVWYLPGEQLGRLMMTGATLLWQRLKSPTVVKSIKLGKDFTTFKSLPAFLRELPSLEELLIYSPDYKWSGKSGMKLESLPSGLRKLELSGRWKISASKLFSDPAARVTFGEHLPRLETLNLAQVDFGIRWFTHAPQSLTKLSLYLWKGRVELPTSLIHFDAYDVVLSRRTFVSKLPPALESFVVSNEFIGADLVLPLLPPSVHRLSLGCESDDSIGLEPPHKLLERLPRSLTWLSVPEIDGIDFEANPELMVLLSSTLTRLELDPILPRSAWPLLPQHLTTLSFQPPGDVDPVASTTTDIIHYPDIPFDSLPRSITRLELFTDEFVFFCGPPRVSNQSYFPPQLAFLSIQDVHFCPDVAKLLPSSLTYLKVGNLCEQVCQHLPSHLKTLKSNATLMSPNLIKFLPKSLTNLHIRLFVSEECDWFDYNTGRPTFDEDLTLPEFTIHKGCTSKGFNWKDASSLPSTLTSLRISNGSELGDSFLKYQHLPNLLELDLRDSKNFTNLSIRLLPPHLTTLNMSKSYRISGKSFRLLPRCLTHLNLESSKSIFDSDIQHLPRTLKQLTLDQAIHLTDLCVPELPPHLEELNLRRNSIITPSSLPSFPHALLSSSSTPSYLFRKLVVSHGF